MNKHWTTTRASSALFVLLAAWFAAACGRPAGVPNLPSRVVGHCTYTNDFSHREECREYLGDGWTDQSATDDCQGRRSSVVLGSACNYPEVIGYCALEVDHPNVVRVWFPGNDASRCGGSRTGCEFFGGGVFVPQGVCIEAGDADVPSSGLPVFVQPTLTCRDPIAGEAPGQSAGGQVCTWNAISGSTEAGRHYEDYGSCETVRTQRPYYARPPADPPMREGPDPRLMDPAYVAESNWVRSQIESSACVCCHAQRLAPMGPSNWFVDAPGNWVDTFYNSGLALGAGWIDSTAFGAYPAEQNNGFARTTSGFPSTDPERMARFFQNELTQRGLTRETFAGARPFGGPIYDQLVYQPTDCTGSEGVTRDGTITWSGGRARYVYLLSEGSSNPGVPPNLDLPTGTVWRVDVPSDGQPLASGISFGNVPSGASQRFPAAAAPNALVEGTRYYLYVLQDVGIPITRCLFRYPR